MFWKEILRESFPSIEVQSKIFYVSWLQTVTWSRILEFSGVEAGKYLDTLAQRVVEIETPVFGFSAFREGIEGNNWVKIIYKWAGWV